MNEINESNSKFCDPSKIDLEYYKKIKTYSDLLANPEELGEPSRNGELEAFVLREARLLDQRKFDDWLSLFSENGCYWIPGSSPANSPAEEITLEFHDLRRLKDRIVRLQTGVAYSQIPVSRTNRVVSFPEIWSSDLFEDCFFARSSFVLHESRNETSQIISGWYGYVVNFSGGDLRLSMKQINLNDCIAPQGNHSFFL